jgi:hypothetical protein
VHNRSLYKIHVVLRHVGPLHDMFIEPNCVGVFDVGKVWFTVGMITQSISLAILANIH